MTSFHHILINLPQNKPPIFHHLYRTTTITYTTPFNNPTPNWANTITDYLTNCTNLHQLNQTYAHILKTHMLHFHNAPFYYNTLMRSYTNLNSPQKALYIFITMSRDNVKPDFYSLPIVLKSVSKVFDVALAKQLHGVAIKNWLKCDMFCESGFISLYFKGGDFGSALKVFEENPERELGSWNAVICGLSQCGRGEEALGMFVEMKREGFREDDVTMVSVTSACGSLGDLELGVRLHTCVLKVKSVARSEVLMMNSLVDMYGKCGRMDLAYRVFSRMGERNVSSWTSMIVGYAMHGHVHEAVQFFREMREVGVRPNHVTFVGVLSACVHGGMVEDGKYYFNMMKREYAIDPKLQHYGCMVDLLGRAGLLEEAREMVEMMPMKANVVIWGCLMGACEKHGNVKMGEWVASHLIELEPWNDGVYVVLSNIYACNGLWEEVERIRGIMKEGRLAKIPGYSLSTSSE